MKRWLKYGINGHVPPLFLSTRQTTDKDLDDTFFWRWGKYYRTQKWYMTINSMTCWIDNILSPYVNIIRSFFKQDLKCVLIGDGLNSHFHTSVEGSFQKIGNITTIPLPPHSSHISQMLDATIPCISRYLKFSK